MTTNLIDTKEFGLAKSFDRVRYEGQKLWKVTFDTGAILLLPEALFEVTSFNLDHVDRPKS